MKHLFRNKLSLALILSVLLLFTLGGCGSGGEDTISEDVTPNEVNPGDINWDFYNQRAEEFVTAITRSDFEAAVGMFDETMAALIDAEALQAMWEEDIIAIAGAFITIHEIENVVVDEFYISGVIMRHESSGLGWNIIFSEDGLIAGLSTAGIIPLPADVGNGQAADGPIQREGFVDYPIVIGEGTAFPLDGILSMPDDVTGPVPAVVIVHGSGANDMDGTMPGAGNTPYRDIAEFLAANGIAVIRYDKRTFTHGLQMMEELGGSFTVWEESIEDALLAAEMLRADPRIDADRTYLVGHSLGGILAPRIHTKGGDFAGLVLMGATPRPFLEVLIEQTRASISTAIEEGLVEEKDMADMLVELDQLAELSDALADMPSDTAKETPVPMLGGSTMAYYFKDLMVHAFENYAQNITAPILVMQGGRDFQILADVDFALFQEIFAGQDNVTFRLYEDLNHSFIPTTAENFIEHAESIMEPGHVYTPALRDIVDWILGR